MPWLLALAACATPPVSLPEPGPLPTVDTGYDLDAVLYVVRHAEKTLDGGDPPLTERGFVRAEALARVLRDVPLVGVHSTDTARTVATAEPTALDQGLEVEIYGSLDADEVVAEARGIGGAHLFVGHSYSIGGLVSAAGGDPGVEVTDDVYDRMYVVVLPADGPVTTLQLSYGPPNER